VLLKNIAENPDDMREEIGMGQTPYAGIKITLTDEEMDHALHDILEIADANHDGDIGRSEVIGAVSVWLRILEKWRQDEWRRKIKEKKAKQGCCVVS